MRNQALTTTRANHIIKVRNLFQRILNRPAQPTSTSDKYDIIHSMIREFDIHTSTNPLVILRLEGTENSDCFRKVEEKIKLLLKGFPLEKCSFGEDVLTYESGFYAPKGWAFKVTGCFEVGASTGGNDFNWMDTFPSFALWKLNLQTNPDYEGGREYFKELILQGLSNEEAYKEVFEDMDMSSWPGELPRVFKGKIVSLPLLRSGKAFNPDEDSQLFIKEPVIISHTRECLGVINIPYGGKISKVLYDSDEANWINWSQLYARIDLTNISAKCNISLIKSDDYEQSAKLYVPKPKRAKLVLPHKSKP